MLRFLLLATLVATAPHTLDESRVYEFSRPQDLDDFEVLAGKWTVSGGALACTTKGQQDEIRWRRRLPGRGVIHTEILSAGATGIRLRGDGHEVRVELQRSRGTFTVHVDGVRRHQGYFEKRRRGLPLQVSFSASGVEVVPGDDEPARVEFREPIPTLVSMSLTSARAQARFARLSVKRPARDDTDESTRKAEIDAAAENLGLAIQDARRLVDQRRFDEAMARLTDAIPETVTAPQDALSDDGVRLLNEIALLEPRLRREPPLRAWLADRRTASRDGTVSLLLPLGTQWSAEAPLARRVDGELLRLRCKAPALTITLYRYDQRIQYWFGEEPRTVYVSGSSASALARARSDDLLVERQDAEMITAPRRSRTSLGGQPTTELEMSYVSSVEGSQGEPVRLREYYAAHRGNTHRLTILGEPEAVQVSGVALAWILDTLEFHKP